MKKKKTSKKKVHKKPIKHKKKKIEIKENISFSGKKKKTSKSKKSKKNQITIKEGIRIMAGTKKKYKHHRKTRVVHSVKFLGDPGRDHGFGSALMTGSEVAVGALGGSVIGKLLPFGSIIQSGAPTVLGIGLMTIRSRLTQSLGAGMAAIGIYSLLKSFMPAIPLLGEEPKLLLSPQQAKMMGIPFDGDQSIPQQMGIPFNGEELPYRTSANI